jgi:putative ATPase
VENGTVVLVGATTQNPYFEVISALVSRSRIFQLKPLDSKDLREIAKSALADPVRGYGRYRVTLDEEALEHLVRVAAGDARSLLNAIELAVETTPERFPPPEDQQIRITLEIAEESIQRKAVLYDKEGDYHFDTISAFIKSLRGSDPDAALYWMARMIHSGEDPHYVFRRMLILASEDVGLGDPLALTVVESAAAAFDRVGMPEGQFHLTEAALYLATAPKSNSALSFFDALEAVKEEAAGEVPVHLKDANRDKEGFGHGEGYLYPHAYREHWVSQQYLPKELQGRIFYEPSESGYEGGVRKEILKRRESQLAALQGETPDEVLTFSPENRGREQWLARISSRRSEVLSEIRDGLFSQVALARHHRVLVLNADNGLLLWEAFRRVPEGGVWAIVGRAESASLIQHTARSIPEEERPTIIEGALPDGLDRISNGEVRFEAIIGLNALLREKGRPRVAEKLLELIEPGGTLVLAETVPRHAQRLSDYLDSKQIDAGLLDRYRAAEDEVYRRGPSERTPKSPVGAVSTDWDENDLLSDFESAGFSNAECQLRYFDESRIVTKKQLDSWFDSGAYYGATISGRLAAEEISLIATRLAAKLSDKVVAWKKVVAFLSARRGV